MYTYLPTYLSNHLFIVQAESNLFTLGYASVSVCYSYWNSSIILFWFEVFAHLLYSCNWNKNCDFVRDNTERAGEFNFFVQAPKVESYEKSYFFMNSCITVER